MRRNLRNLLIAAAFVALASPASAQATRTWVSGVGDDVNPCSRTAPCKTFAGAISKTAAGGEIDALDPGGYGTLTITKSITVDGGGTFASTLAAGTTGFIINAATSDKVTIRNVSINGAGTGIDGIRILQARAVHVENVQIFGFTGKGINAMPSNVSSELYVHNVTIRNIGDGGINLQPSQPYVVLIDGTTVERALFGIRAGDRTAATVSNCTITRAVNSGLQAVASAGQFAEMNIEGTLSSNHGAAGVSSEGSGAAVRIIHTFITRNTTGISTSGGGQVISGGTNTNMGNGTDGAPTATVGPS
jgi:hypothetical protein